MRTLEEAFFALHGAGEGSRVVDFSTELFGIASAATVSKDKSAGTPPAVRLAHDDGQDPRTRSR
jgi:hypothetical protein